MRCTPTASARVAATSCVPAPCCRRTTNPDFLDNYELGFKSRWAGGRYTLNLTAYHMEWQDYQVEVVDPGPLYAVLVANVGDAEIDGVSLDFTAFLWDSLDFGLNLQLLDPKTKANEPILGLLPGDRLPFSAEEKGAVWAEYTFPRRDRGRQPLRTPPVELHGQFAQRPSHARARRRR